MQDVWRHFALVNDTYSIEGCLVCINSSLMTEFTIQQKNADVLWCFCEASVAFDTGNGSLGWICFYTPAYFGRGIPGSENKSSTLPVLHIFNYEFYSLFIFHLAKAQDKVVLANVP